MNTTYTHNGITLRVHPDGDYHAIDCMIIREVQTDYFWDNPINPLALRTVLDCGAHIGAFTAYLKHRNPRAQVVSVEADADNYAYLCENVALFTDVTPLHARLGYDPNLTTIIRHPTNSGGHTISISGNGVPSPRMITVEQIMEQLGTIDLLKIDCEGCECDVLVNIPDETLQCIKYIVGERHQTYEEFMSLIGDRLNRHYTLLDRPHPGVPNRGVFLAVQHG